MPKLRTKLLFLSTVVVSMIILAACAVAPAPTPSAFYAIDRGNDTTSSTLYYFDENGNVSVVGDTGFALNTIKVDPTTGTLYGSTRQTGPGACNSCLVTIDTTTGAATAVGPYGFGPIPSIAFTSAGSLFGWSENTDDAVSINKTTGAATVLGEAGISTRGHGMFVDNSGTVWFVNESSGIYTLNTSTGEVTLIHGTGDVVDALPIRGDYDPATGQYWGAAVVIGGSTDVAVMRTIINNTEATLLGEASVDAVARLHGLAFVR